MPGPAPEGMGEILWVTEPTALRDLLISQIGVPGVVTGNELAFLIKDITILVVCLLLNISSLVIVRV